MMNLMQLIEEDMLKTRSGSRMKIRPVAPSPTPLRCVVCGTEPPGLRGLGTGHWPCFAAEWVRQQQQQEEAWVGDGLTVVEADDRLEGFAEGF